MNEEVEKLTGCEPGNLGGRKRRKEKKKKKKKKKKQD